MNAQELDLVGVMLEDPIAWHYSLGIGASANIPAGTIYPLLAKLEKSGWLESRWDDGEASGVRRRLYRLTGAGQRCAAAALAEKSTSGLTRPRRRFGFRIATTSSGVRLAVGLLLVTILGTLIGSLLAIEAKAWMPYLSGRLARSTLDRMPDGVNEEVRLRWREEIEADLDAYSDRPLGGFFFALRLRRRGGRRLAAELMLSHALKSGSMVEGKSEDELALAAARLIKVSLRSGHQVSIYECADGRVLRRTAEFDDDPSYTPEIDERLRAGETIDLVFADAPQREDE